MQNLQQKFLGGRRSFKNAQNLGSRERLSVLFTLPFRRRSSSFLVTSCPMAVSWSSHYGDGSRFHDGNVDVDSKSMEMWMCPSTNSANLSGDGLSDLRFVFFAPDALNFPLDRSATSEIHFVDCKKVAFQTGFLFVQ